MTPKVSYVDRYGFCEYQDGIHKNYGNREYCSDLHVFEEKACELARELLGTGSEPVTSLDVDALEKPANSPKYFLPILVLVVAFALFYTLFRFFIQ